MATLHNPIIPGFYPDPSVIRVGEDYYLACSSFELCPGIPLFHSKDLINWEQICNVMTKENGLHQEKKSGNGGMMAPTIRYNNGTYYVICCNFADRGNFIVTAEDPAGPWSEPHWLSDVPGIDASIFFDTDGQCYIMGTGNVWDNGAGVMERGIWLAKYDIENYRLAGEPFTIFNSALRGGASPEAPHLYHIGDWYYLIFAEGGTEHFHAVMAARSKELFSFFEGFPGNPIMTHRHMGYTCPIGNVGHADLVDTPDGDWYAVMLASRLIGGFHKNLGRETYLCPVIWERDWPVMSHETGRMEETYELPNITEVPVAPEKTFDDFDEEELGLYWTFWGTPYKKYWEIRDSALVLQCVDKDMTAPVQPMGFEYNPSYENYAAFIARRQRQPEQTFTCRMHFKPEDKEEAGLALMQAMNHQLHAARKIVGGRQVLTVELFTSKFEGLVFLPGFHCETSRKVLAEVSCGAEDVVLRLDLKGQDFIVLAGESEENLVEICRVDGRVLNPEEVGGMVGTMVGMYAQGNGGNTDNTAAFDWFRMD